MSLLDYISRLPLELFGLQSLPAIPVVLTELLDTLTRLSQRAAEITPAKDGLTTTYTIDGQSGTARDFMYGAVPSSAAADARGELISMLRARPTHVLPALYRQAFRRTPQPPTTLTTDADPRTRLALDAPEQWAMSWTTYQDVYDRAKPLLPTFALTLTDADAASAQFWPTIAQYGLAYNLLVLQKIDPSQTGSLKSAFGDQWTPVLDALAAAGQLYTIDMSIFESVAPQQIDRLDRFTPATITLLQQDPHSKQLTPIMVRVTGPVGSSAHVYTRANATSGAWRYALLAAKTSLTVYGTWLGHVYHWHIVTAAMQMTLHNNLPIAHPITLLLGPQANYLIPFDDVLILLWEHIAPPTSISTPFQLFELLNTFAAGRSFFDDDPTTTLERLGLRPADFSAAQPWDRYPLVPYLLNLWHASEEYVTAFVDVSYADDSAVANDAALQAWISVSADELEGNIRGLPPMRSKAALARVLTSLVYRITIHGASRLNAAANPGLTFVANFPPCLQSTTIPAPDTELETTELLAFLPRTGTIGQMARFYFTFVFSDPYEPFIPFEGVQANLFFPGGPDDRRNQALVSYREAVIAFVETYEPESPQLHQWPLNIET